MMQKEEAQTTPTTVFSTGRKAPYRSVLLFDKGDTPMYNCIDQLLCLFDVGLAQVTKSKAGLRGCLKP